MYFIIFFNIEFLFRLCGVVCFQLYHLNLKNGLVLWNLLVEGPSSKCLPSKVFVPGCSMKKIVSV